MQDRRLKVTALAVLVMMSAGASADVLDISRIGIGAKSIAMGRAQVAAADVSSAIINPAGLASISNFSLTSMYTNLAEEVGFTVLGAAFPIRGGDLGCVGVGYISASTSGILMTSAEARSEPISSTDYGNRMLLFSYGAEMSPVLHFGTALKLYAKSFDALASGSATGFDADVGFMFYPNNSLKFGLALQNVLPTQLAWSTGAKEDIPTSVKMGMDYSIMDDYSVLFDYDSTRNARLGGEWRPREFFAMRGGVDVVPISQRDTSLNFTMGVGINYRGINFDYAYYMDSLLPENSSHYFSFSFFPKKPVVETVPIMPAGKGEARLTACAD